MYTLTFMGKTKTISGWSFVFLMCVIIAALTISAIGLYQISVWLLLATIIVTCSVLVNNNRYALFPSNIQEYVGRAAFIVGFVYFWIDLLWT